MSQIGTNWYKLVQIVTNHYKFVVNEYNYKYLCLDAGKLSDMDVGAAAKDGSDTKIKTTLKGSMGERITKALNKVEEKKRKRNLRRSQVNRQFIL